MLILMLCSVQPDTSETVLLGVCFTLFVGETSEARFAPQRRPRQGLTLWLGGRPARRHLSHRFSSHV